MRSVSLASLPSLAVSGPAVSGRQWPSVTVSGRQWPSVALPSVAVSGCQWLMQPMHPMCPASLASLLSLAVSGPAVSGPGPEPPSGALLAGTVGIRPPGDDLRGETPAQGLADEHAGDV